jgi:recombinational DNA repair ATPase RecF
VERFGPLFSETVRSFCGLNVSVAYRPSLEGPAVNSVQTLAGLRERELRFGTSLTGPHRDAVEILRDGLPCRNTELFKEKSNEI